MDDFFQWWKDFWHDDYPGDANENTDYDYDEILRQVRRILEKPEQDRDIRERGFLTWFYGLPNEENGKK